jgi:hypothetical protein
MNFNLTKTNNWSFKNSYFDNKPFLWNAVSQWPDNVTESTVSGRKLSIVSNILKDKYNLPVNNTVTLVDAAARLFLFKDIEQTLDFFKIWNDIIEYLYKNNLIKGIYEGHYVVHDEYILAPIYDAFGFPKSQDMERIFIVEHDGKNERFWQCS